MFYAAWPQSLSEDDGNDAGAPEEDLASSFSAMKLRSRPSTPFMPMVRRPSSTQTTTPYVFSCSHCR